MGQHQTPHEVRDASMNLLNAVMNKPLDPSYAAAAAHAGDTPRSWLWTGVTISVALVVGCGLSTAVIALRAPDQENERNVLKTAVRAKADEVAALDKELQSKRQASDQAVQHVLSPEQTQDIERFSIVVGRAAVKGPAAQVTLTDPRGADNPATSQEASGKARVLDTDLQVVVNSLWHAGAEAIDVNGVRLTPTAAIREAGAAILVDYRPLASPYVVSAVGPADAIVKNFRNSVAGSHVSYLKAEYGVGVSINTVNKWVSPASSAGKLRYAQQLAPQQGTTTQGTEENR